MQSILSAAVKVPTWHGPTSSPPPAKGKKVLILSDNEAGAGSRLFASSAAQAATAIGWTSTIYDGQGQVQRYATGLEEAVSGHYDGVILVGVDSALVSTQVAAVRKAGIPVVAISNEEPPSPTGVNTNIGYHPQEEAQVVAAYVAQQSGGKADVATIEAPEFGLIAARGTAFSRDIARLCPGCKVSAQLSVTSADLGNPNLVSRIQSTLQANPGVDWFIAPFDDVAVPAVQAIQQMGAAGKIQLIGYEGASQNLSYIRSGTVQVADVAIPYGWIGWEAVDSMNRLFNGATTLPSSVTDNDPFMLLTKSNLPATDQNWTGDFDYQAKYKALWGLG